MTRIAVNAHKSACRQHFIFHSPTFCINLINLRRGVNKVISINTGWRCKRMVNRYTMGSNPIQMNVIHARNLNQTKILREREREKKVA